MEYIGEGKGEKRKRTAVEYERIIVDMNDEDKDKILIPPEVKFGDEKGPEMRR